MPALLTGLCDRYAGVSRSSARATVSSPRSLPVYVTVTPRGENQQAGPGRQPALLTGLCDRYAIFRFDPLPELTVPALLTGLCDRYAATPVSTPPG